MPLMKILSISATGIALIFAAWVISPGIGVVAALVVYGIVDCMLAPSP